MLALEDSSFRGEAVVAPWAGAVALGATRLASKEFAGAAFFQRAEARPAAPGKKLDQKAQEGPEDVKVEQASKKKAKKSQQCIVLSDSLKDVNLYELLGVEESCATDEIKTMFRKLALTYHPDKIVGATEEDQHHWVKMQEAFDILSDAKKRIQYDSMQPFKDDTPESFNRCRQDFYKVFAEVFKRNARFSTKKPVPMLGAADTPLAEVQSFYRFWGAFDSWRDPLADAQMNGEEIQDLDQAECREEKRWMEKENAKVANRYRKAERERLSNLTRLAEQNDPRLLAHLEQKKAEKEAKEEAAAEAKRLKEEAKAAAEAAREQQLLEEQAGKEQAKLAKQVARDQQRREVKEARFALLDFLGSLGLCKAQLDDFCRRLSKEECVALRATPAKDLEAAVHAEMKARGMTPRKQEEASTVAPESSCSEAASQVGEPPRSPSPVQLEPARSPTPTTPIQAGPSALLGEALSSLMQTPDRSKKPNKPLTAAQKKQQAALAKKQVEAAAAAEAYAKDQIRRAEAAAQLKAVQQAARQNEIARAAERSKKEAQLQEEKKVEKQKKAKQPLAPRARLVQAWSKLDARAALAGFTEVLQLLQGRVLAEELLDDDAVDIACVVARAAHPCFDLAFAVKDEPSQVEAAREALRAAVTRALEESDAADLVELEEKLLYGPTASAQLAGLVDGELPCEATVM